MLVIIKSPPDSSQALAGCNMARDSASDIVLAKDAVALSAPGSLGGFCGAAYVIEEDLEGRYSGPMEKGIKLINRSGLERLKKQEGGVLGEF